VSTECGKSTVLVLMECEKGYRVGVDGIKERVTGLSESYLGIGAEKARDLIVKLGYNESGEWPQISVYQDLAAHNCVFVKSP
jgi:hypothetical protein